MIFRPYYYFETGCARICLGVAPWGNVPLSMLMKKTSMHHQAFAASKKMAITHVIDTHVHADHRSGGPALAKQDRRKILSS